MPTPNDMRKTVVPTVSLEQLESCDHAEYSRLMTLHNSTQRRNEERSARRAERAAAAADPNRVTASREYTRARNTVRVPQQSGSARVSKRSSNGWTS